MPVNPHDTFELTGVPKANVGQRSPLQPSVDDTAALIAAPVDTLAEEIIGQTDLNKNESVRKALSGALERVGIHCSYHATCVTDVCSCALPCPALVTLRRASKPP